MPEICRSTAVFCLRARGLPGQEETESVRHGEGDELPLGFYAPYLPDQSLSHSVPVAERCLVVAPAGP